ncbi:MAG TPA: right-handed parallel beta-helix repeat-containing protein [Oligoflexus sp.]|uniref:right-handed parallel beta-helix repeat-containing protein n=1 Tax=Oligoflexus sp. TaxID=1971216 RepID=UPI002D5BC557|nr:right-handed parallel beta-helix repeat-containing protein [Oligoflexus sp.]HYX33195.1 right-handed parallel beta-helix repeat-containing protein [Oligoflexus sp.]
MYKKRILPVLALLPLFFSINCSQESNSSSLKVDSGIAADQTNPAAQFIPDLGAESRKVSAVTLSGTDIAVEWVAPFVEQQSFIIERRSPPSTEWVNIKSADWYARQFRDTGLEPKTVYEYRVSVVSGGVTTVLDLPVPARTDDPDRRSVFFVSTEANASDQDNPGTEGSPWRTLQHAHQQLKPGQTLLVKAGEYTKPACPAGSTTCKPWTDYSVLAITTSGTPDAWITYRNFPGDRPSVRTTIGVNWSGIQVRGASYIVVDGFELIGHSGLVDDNRAKSNAEKTNPTAYATSSGINVTGAGSIAHHVIIRNNYAHDHPLAGIATDTADYITIINNRVANNGRWSSEGGSGISVLVPRDLEGDTAVGGYKIFISNNVSRDNWNEIERRCWGLGAPTDGNGIILDKFRDYKGRALVTNNLVYNNGGRGIHIFHTSNVDVFFNTTFHNSQNPLTADGEITAIESKNVRVRDNIMVARADRPLNSTGGSEAVDFSYNIISGGRSFSATGENNNTNRRVANAGDIFVDASGQRSEGFAFKAGSPAINSASGTVPVPKIDLYGLARGAGTLADVGPYWAFQSHQAGSRLTYRVSSEAAHDCLRNDGRRFST